tara:strand:- start:143 stop:580 length:438 start_codon:yes stop_codon:yes gene_type:complete
MSRKERQPAVPKEFGEVGETLDDAAHAMGDNIYLQSYNVLAKKRRRRIHRDALRYESALAVLYLKRCANAQRSESSTLRKKTQTRFAELALFLMCSIPDVDASAWRALKDIAEVQSRDFRRYCRDKDREDRRFCSDLRTAVRAFV